MEVEIMGNKNNEDDIRMMKMILEKRPAEWEKMPDISLYMDQVLEYMKRQHIGLEEEESLTAAMVNNYIKRELLPRAHGKKYNREHIAYLTGICLFKQVISVDDTDTMLKIQLKEKGIEEFYKQYCTILDGEFHTMAQKLDACTDGKNIEDMNEDVAAKLLLELTISSYVQKITCEKLLKKFPK